MFGIRRGKFIAVLCGAAWPSACARSASNAIDRVFPDDAISAVAHLMAAFRRGLNEVGFIEGSERRDRAALDRR
jgi:hypothetical protein